MLEVLCELVKLVLLRFQAKFQHKHDLEVLKNTSEKKIAEANQYDNVFGIGIAIYHPDV